MCISKNVQEGSAIPVCEFFFPRLPSRRRSSHARINDNNTVIHNATTDRINKQTRDYPTDTARERLRDVLLSPYDDTYRPLVTPPHSYLSLTQKRLQVHRRPLASRHTLRFMDLRWLFDAMGFLLRALFADKCLLFVYMNLHTCIRRQVYAYINTYIQPCRYIDVYITYT